MLFTHEQVSRLNSLELTVYHAIQKLEQRILTMRIRELAQETHVSTTVVLNFCKKMNCAGWSEFKLKYREHILKPRAAEQLPSVTPMKPIIEFLQFHAQEESRRDAIDAVVRQIIHARKVIFIGEGPSGVLAKYASWYLSSLGKSSYYNNSPRYTIAQEDHSQTVLIALSVSGETDTTVNRLFRFKELGATVVAVTNTGQNTVSSLADLSLCYHITPESLWINDQYDSYHVNLTSQIPVIYFIETIAKRYHQLINSGSQEHGTY